MTNCCTSILFSILKSITCVGIFRKKNLISLTEGLLCNSREPPSYSWGIDWEASWMETLFNGPLWGQFECSWQFVGMSVDVRHLVFFCQAKLIPLSLQLVNRAFRIGCQFCTCGIWLLSAPRVLKKQNKDVEAQILDAMRPLKVASEYRWSRTESSDDIQRSEAVLHGVPLAFSSLYPLHVRYLEGMPGSNIFFWCTCTSQNSSFLCGSLCFSHQQSLFWYQSIVFLLRL